MPSAPFHFKKFSIVQDGAAHAVGTDGVLLGAWADTTEASSILDIGTGTGLIALMLAQRSAPGVRITSVELQPDAAACARLNFERSPWSERLEVLEMAVQQFADQTKQTFDLIVSNPPFFSELTVSSDKNRRLGRHTGTLSWGDLLDAISKLLSLEGKCCLILPEKEGRLLCEMAVPMGLFCSREVQVRSREGKPVERLLLQLERDPGHFKREMMEIYALTGGYSEAFRGLTQQFYLAI